MTEVILDFRVHYPMPFGNCACGHLHTNGEWQRICAGTLRIGEYYAPRDPEGRGWSNVVVGSGWHGSLRVEARDKWQVSVAWIDDANDVQLNGLARNVDPEIALANAIENLQLPDEFLAALKRPV